MTAAAEPKSHVAPPRESQKWAENGGKDNGMRLHEEQSYEEHQELIPAIPLKFSIFNSNTQSMISSARHHRENSLYSGVVTQTASEGNSDDGHNMAANNFGVEAPNNRANRYDHMVE